MSIFKEISTIKDKYKDKQFQNENHETQSQKKKQIKQLRNTIIQYSEGRFDFNVFSRPLTR